MNDQLSEFDSGNNINGFYVTKLNKDAKIPTRGTSYSAGLDLNPLSKVSLLPGEQKLIKTGLSMSIPNGYYAQISPRSSLAYKFKIGVRAGVIDSDYRGEVKVLLENTGSEAVEFTRDDAIAQLILIKISYAYVLETETLDETKRGSGGFGSTGKIGKIIQ